MASPNYLGFSLANIVDLLRLCLECEEFSEYSENSCENMADFAKLPVVFTEYPEFFGIFYHYECCTIMFVWNVLTIWDLPTNL